MATKRKPWPKEKLRQKYELIDAAPRLYSRCLILWEYGCTLHNIAYLRTELPQIKVVCEKQVLTVRAVLKGNTVRTPRSMIADLNEVKGIMYELIAAINHAQRYMAKRDYQAAIKYATDLKDYAWEFEKIMEEYVE